MRQSVLVLAIALLPSGAMAHGDFPAKRGGVVVWAGETTLEFVISKDRVVVYVDDHGEPVPNKGAEGTLVVPSADGQGRAVPMKAAKANAFESPTVALKPGEEVKFFAKMADGQVHVGQTIVP